MTRSEPAEATKRSHVRRTAWIVGVIAAAIYLGSIIEAVLRR